MFDVDGQDVEITRWRCLEIAAFHWTPCEDISVVVTCFDMGRELVCSWKGRRQGPFEAASCKTHKGLATLVFHFTVTLQIAFT